MSGAGTYAAAYARAVLRGSDVLAPSRPLPASGLVVLPARLLMKQLAAGHRIDGQQLTPPAEHWVCGGGVMAKEGRQCGCGQRFKEVSTSAGRHTPGIAQIPIQPTATFFNKAALCHLRRATSSTCRWAMATPTLTLSTSRRRWKPPLSAAWGSGPGVPYASMCRGLPIKNLLTSRVCWAGAC